METPSAPPPPPQSESHPKTGTPSPSNGTSPPTTVHISDKAALAAAWNGPHPIITHLNADTTWILHLPYPEGVERPSGRSRFNVLLDPWLQGPQSDGGRWFSVQWHVIAPSVQTIKELNGLLAELEKGGARAPETDSYIDVVAISHEFTDHCHEATLRELPSNTPILAPDKAAKLIRSWKHFDAVTEMPPFVAAETKDWRKTLACAPLPSWVGIGRVVTPGNSLYYHSAILIAWTGSSAQEEANCVVYSPHGIESSALAGMKGTGLRTLALLHGLDDVRLWMTKQLNLGAVNGISAARECGAKYWVATHDEVKKGGGFVSLLLRRTTWSVADAVKREGERGLGNGPGDDKQAGGYEFVELGSGDGLVLA
ncbi:hypothetical protein F5B22DRAFT_623459 [Xylaria bambusicola]|uniref:uncharacterized protein n=1 Tax=Xylaria bambusicola TaxID=326684 RepID=UPI002007F72A|nr:uncharacterized protein F5B22DRAFT_623459 [Xylaria bambusicola]KAI0506548.1 hypothetical protein F5B22DRAFT_623459 [Xylaria bambusicola]